MATMTSAYLPTFEGSGSKRAVEDGEGSAPKNPRGRPVKVGLFHDFIGPTHFAKVIWSPRLDMMPIHDGFRPYIGVVPRMIVLKTNTGCSWVVKLREVSGRVWLDQGWPGFSITHQIKIGYFMTFKVLKGDLFKVTIFDYYMTELVKKFPQHDPALAMIDE